MCLGEREREREREREGGVCVDGDEVSGKVLCSEVMCKKPK